MLYWRIVTESATSSNRMNIRMYVSYLFSESGKDGFDILFRLVYFVLWLFDLLIGLSLCLNGIAILRSRPTNKYYLRHLPFLALWPYARHHSSSSFLSLSPLVAVDFTVVSIFGFKRSKALCTWAKPSQSRCIKLDCASQTTDYSLYLIPHHAKHHQHYFDVYFDGPTFRKRLCC